MWIIGDTELRLLGCLILAIILGSIIGFERQWRQRIAGLRTNALVSLGSAAFASLSLLVDGEISKTRIAAQVVSGIGFIGAGLIFKEGSSVRGLNTAATLWGSSAVGVTAGLGYPIIAMITTMLILSANLLLRPLTLFLNTVKSGATELIIGYRLIVVCDDNVEAHIRSIIFQKMSASALTLQSLKSENIEDSEKVAIEAKVIAHEKSGQLLEDLVMRIGMEKEVYSVKWEIDSDQAMVE